MDLKEFLKTHSTISNEFIDVFLSFYDPETIQTDFVVDAAIVVKWLGIQKKYMMETLRSSYKEGIDYKVEKSSNKKGRYGGNNYKTILLTPDCFKRVCMRSKSKRSEEVRTYFIQLESLLVRYKSHLLEGMDAEIKRMEKAARPKREEDSVGYVYIIKASPDLDSVYKIGRTKDLTKRLATYSTGTADGVEVLFKFRTDNHRAVEGCVKAWLKEYQYRKYKEVYQANINMIKRIISGCDGIGLGLLKKEFISSKAPKMTGGYYLVLGK